MHHQHYYQQRNNSANRHKVIVRIIVQFLIYINAANAFSNQSRLKLKYFDRAKLNSQNSITPYRCRLTVMQSVGASGFDTAKTLFRAYQTAAENSGLLTDIFTSGAINTLSDSLAQRIEVDDAATINPSVDGSSVFRNNFDVYRTMRLVLFGLADGAVSHGWFVGLDQVFGDGDELMDAVVKTFADISVYTPLWCAWFLAAMTILEAVVVPQSPLLSDGTVSNNTLVVAGMKSIPQVWKSDWIKLLKGNVGFFIPITGIIYGTVPRQDRVLAFGVAGVVYTTILSLWNKERALEE